MKTKSYNELMKLNTFEERFRYLKTDSSIGDTTFGSNRYYNQQFYNSEEWKKLRKKIIVRDRGCNLGMIGCDISNSENIVIHHIEPITITDIKERTSKLTDPNNLITVSSSLHKAIHYGSDYDINEEKLIERKPNDTCPWK